MAVYAQDRSYRRFCWGFRFNRVIQLMANNADNRKKRSPWPWVVAAIAVTGTAISVGVRESLLDRQDRLIAARFDLVAEDRVQAIEREFAISIAAIQSLRALYAASREVERHEFHAFCKTLVAENEAIQAFEWIPRIQSAEREIHEQITQAQGFDAYQITVANGAEMVRAPDRKEHFPVHFIEPMKGNEKAFGFDLSSNAVRLKALKKARDADAPIATSRIRLVQETGRQNAILVIVPIFRKEVPNETAEQRQQNLSGYILAAFRIGDTVVNAIGAKRASDMSIHIFDESAAPSDRLLHTSLAQNEFTLLTHQAAVDDTGVHFKRQFRIAGRRWLLHCKPTQQFLARQSTSGPTIALVIGLIFTAFLAALLWALTKRTVAVEAIAAKNAEERDSFWELSLDLMCIAGFDGNLKKVNPAWERTLGHSARALLSQPYMEFVHPDDRITTAAEAERLFEGHIMMQFENRFKCTDHSYKWLLWNAVPLPDKGLIYAAARDITKQKRDAQELKESEERFRDLFENSSDLIQSVDPTGKLLYVNPAWCQTLGYSAEESKSLNIFSIIHPDSMNHCQQTFEKLMTGEELERIDAVFLTKHGERIYVEGNVSCRFEDGKPVATRGIFRDITERRISEQALTRQSDELARSNADLEQFAYIASHDLRSPLRAIANLSEWIEEDLGENLTGEAQVNMDLLRGRIARMETLIDDLLAYSRAGRAPSDFRDVNTHDLVKDVIFLMNPPEQFKFVIHSNMPIFETAPGPLKQVFSNLIGNAIKHHDRPDGCIEISAKTLEDFYEFQVTDDGPGIDPKFHERAFQLFHTLQSRDKVEGSGMGLALVKKVVETEGGCVKLESERGHGTTFRFTWPLQTNRELVHER